MFGTQIVAVRNLARRARADILILAPVAIVLLLAMMLLAAGPIYATAITERSLVQSLTAAPAFESSITVSGRLPAAAPAKIDRDIRQALSSRLRHVGHTTVAIFESAALELPDLTTDDHTAITTFQYIDDLDDHGAIVAGRWPAVAAEFAVDGRFDVAISRSAAAIMGVQTEAEIDLVTRRTGEPLRVTVVGIFDLNQTNDALWADDPLMRNGSTELGPFVQYGPMIVAPDALTRMGTSVDVTWRVLPDFASLAVANATRLRSRIIGLEDSLNATLADTLNGLGELDERQFSELTVETGLSRLLSGIQQSLAITKSSVLALQVQLAALALYALVLAAGLLAERRQTETDLVRMRGGAVLHLSLVASFEALALTVPAAVAAPQLAAWSLGLLDHVGPLASNDIGLNTDVSTTTYLPVAVAVVVAVATLAWPAARSARPVRSRRRNRRQTPYSSAQSSGLDIALGLFALAGYWQLRSLGADRVGTIQGRFDVDPLLIVAPALGMAAGAVLALRIIPLVARLGERVARSGRTVVPALAAWQLARRPMRYGRSALLLVMAIAIGTFTAAYSSTWTTSQADQAAHQVGADSRVIPNRRTGDSVTDLHLTGLYLDIESIDAVMPVQRRSGPISGNDDVGRLILLDAAAAPDVVVVRAGQAELAALFTEMVAARPDIGRLELPGEPDSIELSISATELPVVDHRDQPVDPAFRGSVRLVIEDGHGLQHRVDMGSLVLDGAAHVLTAPLAADSINGVRLRPSYPLSIVALEIATIAPPPPTRPVQLKIDGVVVHEGDTKQGQAVSLPAAADRWTVDVGSLRASSIAPSIVMAPSGDASPLSLTLSSGADVATLTINFGLRPAHPEPSQSLPVVVTTQWLTDNFLSIGDEISMPVLGLDDVRARIIGAVDLFPTVDPARGHAVVADLVSVQRLDRELGGAFKPHDEYWFSRSGLNPGLRQRLIDAPVESVEVIDLQAKTDELTSDPIARGTIGALSFGFVAAAVFATVGFAVSVAVSARERLQEFALLRALGLSPRDLAQWMALEHGVLVVLSLLFGSIVGFGLASALLPLVAMAQSGSVAVPPVDVVYAWTDVLLLEAGLVTALAVVVLISSASLARMGMGSRLRMGEQS